MKQALIQYLPWLMSVVSCFGLYLAGSKHKRAWQVLLWNQVLWFIWIPLSSSWGLLPGAFAYTAVAIRNQVVWSRKGKT